MTVTIPIYHEDDEDKCTIGLRPGATGPLPLLHEYGHEHNKKKRKDPHRQALANVDICGRPNSGRTGMRSESHNTEYMAQRRNSKETHVMVGVNSVLRGAVRPFALSRGDRPYVRPSAPTE